MSPPKTFIELLSKNISYENTFLYNMAIKLSNKDIIADFVTYGNYKLHMDISNVNNRNDNGLSCCICNLKYNIKNDGSFSSYKIKKCVASDMGHEGIYCVALQELFHRISIIKGSDIKPYNYDLDGNIIAKTRLTVSKNKCIKCYTHLESEKIMYVLNDETYLHHIDVQDREKIVFMCFKNIFSTFQLNIFPNLSLLVFDATHIDMTFCKKNSVKSYLSSEIDYYDTFLHICEPNIKSSSFITKLS